MRKESLITQIANIYNCLTGLEQDRAIDKLYGEYMASMKAIAIQRYRHHDMRNQMVFQAMSASDYHFAECREWAILLHEHGDELFRMQELEDSLDASPADCIEEQEYLERHQLEEEHAFLCEQEAAHDEFILQMHDHLH